MPPKVFLVRQRIDHAVVSDPAAAITQQLEACDWKVKPGQRVAIAVGSRGINSIGQIVAAAVKHFHKLGVRPFVFPAMGCHGGGNSANQKATLEHLGVTEDRIGCPILSEIEPERIGTSPEGAPVYMDTHARKADHLVVINRIKPHSDFFGSIGSGLVKMLVIGCGKMKGADATHEAAITYGLEHMLRSIAAEVLRSAPVLGGLAVIEGPTGLTERISWVPGREMLTREPQLFGVACRLAPAIPIQRVNLLVVDWVGKNISGCGMDPFVIGRHEYLNVHSSYTRFRADRIYAANLTDESLGNADGIGMADATSKRLVAKLDYDAIRIGVLTSRTLPLGRIPIAFANDREAIDTLLGTTSVPRKEATLIRIRNTTDLELMEISENLLPKWYELGRGTVERGPYEMRFGPDGNLLPLG